MTCTIEGCDRPSRRNGMCVLHSGRVWRNGHPGLVEGPQERVVDFLEDVEWMVSTGETHAEAVAFRLGTTAAALVRRLERHGRSDLIARIEGRYSDIPACFTSGKRA